MRSFLRYSVALALVFLVGGVLSQAQDWYQQRQERFRGEHWRAHLFEHVREDLNHVQSTTFPGRDEFRLERAKHQLGELQADLTSGRYEEPKLDEVIHTIQRVAADNRLSPRDRDILNDDLQRLRDYRAHHAGWMH